MSVGTIVPWYPASNITSLPSGWFLCDGGKIEEGPLAGLNRPNLKDEFIFKAVSRSSTVKFVEKKGTLELQLTSGENDHGFCFQTGDKDGINGQCKNMNRYRNKVLMSEFHVVFIIRCW